MKTVDFQTSLGVVRLAGQMDAFCRRRPALLAITGAWAPSDDCGRIPLIVGEGWDGFVAHLPGNHCPNLTETSVQAFGRAFDEASSKLGRPLVVFGVSAGALVAMAMTQASAIMAVEPPLSGDKLWPMKLMLQASKVEDRAFVDAIFGRRHHQLVDALRVPTTVVVGSDPLFPTRELSRFPSFVDDEDREFLRASPLVTLKIMPNAGHDVPRQAGYALHETMLEVCNEALQRASSNLRTDPKRA